MATRWTPVKNLTFSAEVGAFFLDQKMSGVATLAASAPKPTTVYEFKDQSTVYLNLRLGVTSDPERLETLEEPPAGTAGGFVFSHAVVESPRLGIDPAKLRARRPGCPHTKA